VLSADELQIVHHLDAAVAAHPKVTFGSYPYVSTAKHFAFKTVITLEAADRSDVAAAAETLLSLIPAQHVIDYLADDDSLKSSDIEASSTSSSGSSSSITSSPTTTQKKPQS
jgi:hypothetical protein